jgi:ribosomal protein S18 acetylase RimI-like enzyme
MIEVRRVRADEWQELRALRLEALENAPDAFWTRYEEAVERPEEAWREWTAMPCHVAVESGRLVGMVAGASDSDDPSAAHLIAMYVTPAARSRGVGDALVEAQLAWARAEGFERVNLMVNVANGGAIRLYERLGFRDTGVRALLREGPHVLAAMSVELEAA